MSSHSKKRDSWDSRSGESGRSRDGRDSRDSKKRKTEDSSRYRCETCGYQTPRKSEIIRHTAEHAVLIVPTRKYPHTPVLPPTRKESSKGKADEKAAGPSKRDAKDSKPSSSYAKDSKTTHKCKTEKPEPPKRVEKPEKDEPSYVIISRSPSPIGSMRSCDSDGGCSPRLVIDLRTSPARCRGERSSSPLPQPASPERKVIKSTTTDNGMQTVGAEIDQTRIRNRLTELRAMSESALRGRDRFSNLYNLPRGYSLFRTTERYITLEGEMVEVVTEEFKRDT